MRKTLFAMTAGLLLSVSACCMAPHHGGPGGPGGPGKGCGCKCRHQQDCPQKDCPQGADCPKGPGGWCCGQGIGAPPGPGGPGGPGKGCGCKCRHQQDCPQKDCPQGADCPKGPGGAPMPCPQHQPPAK